ncbi:MAG: hypothetical protein IJB19_04995 [Clostridia bacterium]|nr:hypothetical protein [Clostridia bacterium]
MNQAEACSLFAPCRRKAGNSRLTYTLYRSSGTYGIAVSSDAEQEGQVRVDDIARDLTLAKSIQMLFAENLVFPSNVPEILDDLLGTWQGI